MQLLRKYIKELLNEGVGPIINIKILNKMLKYMVDNNLYTTSRRKKKDLPPAILAKVEQNLNDLKSSQKGEKIIFYIPNQNHLENIHKTFTETEREWIDSQFKTVDKFKEFFNDFFIVLAGGSKRGILGTYIVDRSGLSIVSSRFGQWQKNYGRGWMKALPGWLQSNYSTLVSNNSTFVHEFQHFIQDKLYTGKLNNPDSSEKFEYLNKKEFKFLSIYLRWYYQIDLNSDPVKNKMVTAKDSAKKEYRVYKLSDFQSYRSLLSNNSFRIKGDVTTPIIKFMKRNPFRAPLKDIQFLASLMPSELGQHLIAKREWTDEMTKHFIKKHQINVKMTILNESLQLQSFYTQSFYRTGGDSYGICQFFKATKKHKDFSELRKGNNPDHWNQWGQLATEYDATIAESVQMVFQKMCETDLGYTGMPYPMLADALLDGNYEEFKTLFNQRAKNYSMRHNISQRNIDNNPKLAEKLNRSVEFVYETFMEYIDEVPPPNTDRRFESTEFNEWFANFYEYTMNR